MKDVFDFINEDELTDDLRLLADVCGIDSVRKILKSLAGFSFYVPRISRLEKFIERYVCENETRSTKELALELGVSDQFLKNKKKR